MIYFIDYSTWFQVTLVYQRSENLYFEKKKSLISTKKEFITSDH